ncbi:MAG: fecE [Xanthobacteraceae bacterium]|jgi:iron complex transport system ATP-binding protein|nr:fecE [Xanthobacteraceae bacterium]
MSRAAFALEARGLIAGHGRRTILQGIDLDLPHGGFTVIIGPNACGKSTLLRCLAGLHRPAGGEVRLEGEDMAGLTRKAVARRLGLLPQQMEIPDAITVEDMVGRGRFPHQSLLRQWSVEDEAAVSAAMQRTGTLPLARRRVAELSGGQRQKVAIAMALAQETPILLLDEPISFLDLSHQMEVLELCRKLATAGKTLVAVLHDLNLACRYASRLIVMSNGRIVDSGAPAQIVTEALIERVFDLPCAVLPDPLTRTPMVIPRPVA